MIDQNYNNILEEVLKKGSWYDDPNRKDVKRLEIPSYTFRHEFKDGFPAISTKKLAWKSVVTELLWFLKGDTNIKYLVDNGCNIWNKDAYNYYLKISNFKENTFTLLSFEDFVKTIKTCDKSDLKDWWKQENFNIEYNLGDLGKVYGHYWRNWEKFEYIRQYNDYDVTNIDQIAELINDMINKPMSSELIVSARNPSHKDKQALPCCHYGFQIIMRPLNIIEKANHGLTDEERKEVIKLPSGPQRTEYVNARCISKYGFELHWNQRSCDLFLGIPFNIASYALLALILEKITGHKALGIQGDWKKVHLYDNSIKAAKEQLSRKCSEELVTVEFDNPSYKKGTKFTDIDMFLDELYPEYFELKNYKPQPAIKVEMLERR